MSESFGAARQRLSAIAAKNDLAAIACVPGPNFHYVSGLAFSLMERPTLLFVTADNQVLGIMPELEQQKWSDTFPQAETFYWQDANGYSDAFTAAANALPTGKIGVEGMLMRAFEVKQLETAFGLDRIVLADEFLTTLRLQKSEAEINALQNAISVSENSLDDVFNNIKAGLTEKDIVAQLKQRMLHHGADGFAFDPLVLIGTNSALPHGTPGEKRLTAGDALLIDFGAIYNGLHADITRTVFFEHVSDNQADLYETVLAANLHGRKVAGPDLTAHDLDSEVTTVLRESPFAEFIVHKTGHGLGRQVHEAPQVMVGNHAQLLPGSVLTIEPGLYDPVSLGVRIEDDVLITATGNTTLTTYPRELQVLNSR